MARSKAATDDPEQPTPAQQLPDDTKSAIAFAVNSRATVLAAAEKILLSRAPDANTHGPVPEVTERTVRRLFDAEELGVFDFLGYSNEQLFKELCRLKAVGKLQSLAGTSADRSAAESKLAAARSALAEQEPKLKMKITNAKATLAALELEAAEAERVVTRQQEAVKQLRERVPAQAKEAYFVGRGDIRSELADDIQELERLLRDAKQNPSPEKTSQSHGWREQLDRLIAVRKERIAELECELLDQYAR
jgi:hypothetical protein